MLYIIVALKSEAQAFVDKYKLTKARLSVFSIYSNTNIMLIVSGIGVKNAAQATQTFINHYDITDDDIYLNVGICGASKRYSIGELIQVGVLQYAENTINLPNKDTAVLSCFDKEVSTDENNIVDMESFGFYDAVIHSPAIKNFYILKVVSDHFEPETITKENTKSLIFNVIDDINLLINPKDNT